MFLKDSGILRRARRVTKISFWVLFLSHEVVVMPSTGVISTVWVVHGSIAFFTAIDEITFVSVSVFVEEYTLSGTLPVYEVSFVSLSVWSRNVPYMGRVTEKWSWFNMYISYNECIVFVFNLGAIYADNLLLWIVKKNDNQNQVSLVIFVTE